MNETQVTILVQHDWEMQTAQVLCSDQVRGEGREQVQDDVAFACLEEMLVALAGTPMQRSRNIRK